MRVASGITSLTAHPVTQAFWNREKRDATIGTGETPLPGGSVGFKSHLKISRAKLRLFEK
jgi:hypothetical protein